MPSETPRNLALTALNRFPGKRDFAGKVLDDIFRDQPHLDHRDRAFISHLVYGVFRWQRRLDWIIEQASNFPFKKISPPVLNILRLSLYQIFFLDKVPDSAAVNEAVKQCRASHAPHIVSFVNGILRNLCREKDHITFPDQDTHPSLFLSVTYSYPEWLIEKWISEWGLAFTEELLAAGNHIPSLTIRTNTLKIDRPDLIKRLGREAIKGHPTPYSPEGILVEEMTGRVDESPAFREGLFQVQDEAAQMTAHLLSPQPGERILDLCAGLGGKTTHLAALMGDEGFILALDTNRPRLIDLGNSAERLGIKSIAPIEADATQTLSSLFSIKFDRIVVDAPCSGLGVLSRHPDGKWRKGPGDIRRLARLQSTIIQQTSPLLRSGGKLLYVTCTLSKEENEGVVHHYLKDHRHFVLEDLRDHVPKWGLDLIDNQGFLRTFPQKHHMDGFFAALIRKKE